MKILRKGDHGTAVEEMSRLLVGVSLRDTVSDVFDDDMEMALKAWQVHGIDARGRKLKVDGVFGPRTLESFSVSGNDHLDFTPLPDDLSDFRPSESALRNQALNFAIRELRAGAEEVGGNNQGPFVEKYHRTAKASERQWAWCAAFTSWCFKQASDLLGVDMPFGYTGGAQRLFRDLKRQGKTFTLGECEPRAGDVIVWWRGATRTWKGHVGIVWGYANETLYVIEGNVGRYPARVRMFSYDLTDGELAKLIGFGRP